MIFDYDFKGEKREIQKKLFPLINKKKAVVLAGPNLISYTALYPKKVRNIEIWENKPEVMLTQLEQMAKITKTKNRRFDYRYGDILRAKVDKDAFYDLDFCCTIGHAWQQLEKFRKCQFTATFCNRGSSVDTTIQEFLLIIGEKKIVDIPHRQFNLLKTNKGSYLYTTYTDNSPMTTIFKFDKQINNKD